VPAGDDTEDEGAISVEPTAPGPIGIGMTEQSIPSTAEWVLATTPFGKCGQKHLHPATRRSNLVPQADQVMTQAKLPPYHGHRSPLDVVPIEIIFGRIFEAF
jgi:hypothetical protein